MENQRDPFKDVLLGVAIGDALGVPYEFLSRLEMKQDPATGMKGMGTHKVPAGTWSDDSSLTFCLAESLVKGFYPRDIADKFISWLRNGYWSATGEVFDVGIATKAAIELIEQGIDLEISGGSDEYSNGNGSLMRILPLLFLLNDKPTEVRFELTMKVSSITHRHIRSIIGCFYYLEFALLLLQQKDKFTIYKELKSAVSTFLQQKGINPLEISLFERLLKDDIFTLSENEIRSKGYVMDTLEASIWCLLTTGNYKAAVLKAVNLGGDTDTTAAVTGGLAALLYGFENIPAEWLNQLAKRTEIVDLAERLKERYR